MQSSTITSFYLLILPKLPETQHLRSTFVCLITFHKFPEITHRLLERAVKIQVTCQV